MKKIFFIALFMALILSACNMPNQTQPTPDMVATQVAKVLTEMPVEVITQPTDQPSAATDVPPTTEPTPTNTAEPTATPTPTLTHTPDTSDPAVRLGSPDGIDDFNSVTGKWDYEDDWSSFRVNNGYLNVVSKGTPYWNSWYVTAPKLTDFYLEMVFDMPSCSGDDRIGLAFRAPDLNQFYILGITCNGKWGFERYTSNNDIVNILPYSTSAQLKPSGQVNRVGVWAEGNNFEFYINGIKIGQASDSTHPGAGSIGFISRSAGSSAFTTRIDKLLYWNLP